jgi:hypothetical protein
VGLVLLMCLLLPGVISYVAQESVPYCTNCGRRARGVAL